MDISGVIGMFAAILIASAVFLYIGTIGLKNDTKKDEAMQDQR
ncbi:MAG TPA: hypothetical protein VE089_04330 [Nitrososphaeraceae archaeon]|jgi:hypothetical protein|nr:hypothetical protein [Nitrososphaeraceae archaeon]